MLTAAEHARSVVVGLRVTKPAAAVAFLRDDRAGAFAGVEAAAAGGAVGIAGAGAGDELGALGEGEKRHCWGSKSVSVRS